jgi:hypothetical protein
MQSVEGQRSSQQLIADWRTETERAADQIREG